MADRVKGAFSSIHATGEIARGFFNNTMDSLGDGIANREPGEVDSRRQTSATVLANGQQELNKGMSQMRGSAQDPVVAKRETSASGSNDSILEAEAAVAEHRRRLNEATDTLEAKLAAHRQASTTASATSTGRGHPIDGTPEHVAPPTASPSHPQQHNVPPLPPRHPDTQGRTHESSQMRAAGHSQSNTGIMQQGVSAQTVNSVDSLEHDLPPQAADEPRPLVRGNRVLVDEHGRQIQTNSDIVRHVGLPAQAQHPEVPHSANTSSVPTAGATEEQTIRSTVV